MQVIDVTVVVMILELTVVYGRRDSSFMANIDSY